MRRITYFHGLVRIASAYAGLLAEEARYIYTHVQNLIFSRPCAHCFSLCWTAGRRSEVLVLYTHAQNLIFTRPCSHFIVYMLYDMPCHTIFGQRLWRFFDQFSPRHYANGRNKRRFVLRYLAVTRFATFCYVLLDCTSTVVCILLPIVSRRILCISQRYAHLPV